MLQVGIRGSLFVFPILLTSTECSISTVLLKSVLSCHGNMFKLFMIMSTSTTLIYLRLMNITLICRHAFVKLCLFKK